MIFGKLIAGLIGLVAGGWVGLIIGLIIGHSFDKGLKKTFLLNSPENIARIQRSFFETTFLLLGHLAKADGRISQQEIDHTESIIGQMRLDHALREQAIGLFRRGAAADFQLEATLTAFNQVCGSQRQLQQTLLSFLISLALADNHQLEQSESIALQRIAELMGFSAAQLAQLLRMMQAQDRFHSGHPSGQSLLNEVDEAYLALGVNSQCSDQELKRAYRKLMSQHHPDKLIAKGVPDSMLKLATEKSQEIQAAYEVARKHRARKDR